MKYPKFLEDNNCIGIPAPSDGAYDDKKKNKFKHSVKYFEDNNYKLVLSDNLYKSKMGRSASAEVRGKEINDMFSNKAIDFLICAAGGEFLVECLPYVDFKIIKDNPKFIAGFSDPTGLLFPITTKLDIATIYGNNFGSFGEKFNKSQYDFLDIIKGNLIEINNYPLYEEEKVKTVTGLEGPNLTKKVKWKSLDNKDVNVTGRIIGGCFDLISELAGTKYDGMKEFNEKYKNDGIIWYFDNCELSMEEVIRVLWKMNELDYFKYTKAVIFGRFGVEVSYNDYDVKTCLEDSILSKLNIPVIYDADISHKPPTIPVINGSIATIKLSNNKATIKYELK